MHNIDYFFMHRETEFVLSIYLYLSSKSRENYDIQCSAVPSCVMKLQYISIILLQSLSGYLSCLTFFTEPRADQMMRSVTSNWGGNKVTCNYADRCCVKLAGNLQSNLQPHNTISAITFCCSVI